MIDRGRTRLAYDDISLHKHLHISGPWLPSFTPFSSQTLPSSIKVSFLSKNLSKQQSVLRLNQVPFQQVFSLKFNQNKSKYDLYYYRNEYILQAYQIPSRLALINLRVKRIIEATCENSFVFQEALSNMIKIYVDGMNKSLSLFIRIEI